MSTNEKKIWTRNYAPREILNITRQKSEMISKQEVGIVRLKSEQFVMQ